MAPSAQPSPCVLSDLDTNEPTNESKPFRRTGSNQRVLNGPIWKSSENTKASEHKPVDGEEVFKLEWIMIYSLFDYDILKEHESITLITYMYIINIHEQCIFLLERLLQKKFIADCLRSVGKIENSSLARVGSISRTQYALSRSLNHDTPLGLQDESDNISGDLFSRNNFQLREETDPLVNNVERDHHDKFSVQDMKNSIASEQSQVPIENSETGSNASARLDSFPNTSRDDQERDGDLKATDNSYELLHRDLYDEENVNEIFDHSVNAHQSGDAGDIIGQHCSPVSQEVFARDSELHGFGDVNSIQHDSPLPEEFEDASRYFSLYHFQLHEETDAAVSENDAEHVDPPLNVRQSDDTGHIRRQQWSPASAERLSQLGCHFSTRYRPASIYPEVFPIPLEEEVINLLDFTDDSLTTDSSCASSSPVSDESDSSSDENPSHPPQPQRQSDVRQRKLILNNEHCPTNEDNQTRFRKRKVPLTMKEYNDIQRKILQFSRDNDNVVTSVCLDGDQIAIGYSSYKSIHEDSLNKQLVELLGSEVQIKLIPCSNHKPLKRTVGEDPGSFISHPRNEISKTSVSGFVCVSDERNEKENYALVCGHDKQVENDVILESNAVTLGQVKYVLFRDVEPDSMDAALVKLLTDEITPYVTCKYDIPNKGTCDVRIYIKKPLEEIQLLNLARRCPRIQLHITRDRPTVGYIVRTPYTYPGNGFDRPLYNAIGISADDSLETIAIHGECESGILVTTEVRHDRIIHLDGRYVAFVKAVGMLVATVENDLGSLSLALPIDKTFADLIKYMNHCRSNEPEVNMGTQISVPADKIFFIVLEGDSKVIIRSKFTRQLLNSLTAQVPCDQQRTHPLVPVQVLHTEQQNSANHVEPQQQNSGEHTSNSQAENLNLREDLEEDL